MHEPWFMNHDSCMCVSLYLEQASLSATLALSYWGSSSGLVITPWTVHTKFSYELEEIGRQQFNHVKLDYKIALSDEHQSCSISSSHSSLILASSIQAQLSAYLELCSLSIADISLALSLQPLICGWAPLHLRASGVVLIVYSALVSQEVGLPWHRLKLEVLVAQQLCELAQERLQNTPWRHSLSAVEKLDAHWSYRTECRLDLIQVSMTRIYSLTTSIVPSAEASPR